MSAACVSCGSTLSAGARFCGVCGSAAVTTSRAGSRAVPPIDGTQVPSQNPYARQSRPSTGRTPVDVFLGGDWPGALFAAALSLAVMGVLALVVALLLEVGFTVGAGLASTMTGGFLFALAALGLMVLVAVPQALRPPARRYRDLSVPVLIAATSFLVFTSAVLAVITMLSVVVNHEGQSAQELAIGLFALPNAALGAVLFSLGIPLRIHLAGSLSEEGQDVGMTPDVNLLSLTADDLRWWLLPGVLLLVLLATAVIVVLRQHTLRDGRREGLRLAGGLAVAAFAASFLSKASVEVAASSNLSESLDMAGGSRLAFNPALAALIAACWGLAVGVLAPALAGLVPVGVVQGVRRRFGTAPLPRAHAPVPAPMAAPPPPAGAQSGYRQPTTFEPPARELPDH